jgi:cysteine desulfurase/selenocysteine lyase
MTLSIAQLHANEELRRHEFPVAAQTAFFAHAGVCPLPRRVIDSMTDYVRLCGHGDQEEAFPGRRFQSVRRAAAQLLQAQMDEIALVGPTSSGLNMVAAGLPLRRGDNILIYQDDFPSNVYPWMALAEKGVEVRLMNVRELGRIRTIDVTGQVDENTRLVALGSCHFVTGWRIDLAGIGSFLRSRNICFCVDGIQTLGAFPTAAEHFDVLAADGHKWLLGPCSAGLLYVRKSFQEVLKPSVFGWHNVRCPEYVAQDRLVYPPDGRRYEAGTANLVGLAGLQAAIELVLEIGVEAIAAELLRKRRWMVPELSSRGYVVLQADAPPEHASGIITFHKPGADLPALHDRLTAAGFCTSLRADRAGQRYLRLSPHFYNTDAELHRLLDLL